MTNGKCRAQSAARIAALSALSLVVMAVVLTTAVSATVTTTQQGWQDLTAGVSYRYQIPFNIGVIAPANDDSQAPAVGGVARQYAHPYRYIAPATSNGSQSLTTGGSWAIGYGYDGYYIFTTYNSVGYALIDFDHYLDADNYTEVCDYLPRIGIAQFNTTPDTTAQADAYGVEIALTIDYYYKTGYHSTSTISTTYAPNSSARVDVYLSSLVSNALDDLVTNDPLEGSQGDIASFKFSVEVVPFEERSDVRVDGHTYVNFLQVSTYQLGARIDSEATYQSLLYTHDDDVGAVAPMPPAENWMSWITGAVGGFMDAPLIGEQFTLGNFLGAICVVLVVVVLLKIFAGG